MEKCKFIILPLMMAAVISLSGCKKDDDILYLEDDRTIQITDQIYVDNGIRIRNPLFNFITINKFLEYLSGSDHFLIVPLKDFENTNSSDKVVLSIRHDIDNDIRSAVKLAYREHKHGIKASFFVLHTAKYYGAYARSKFFRNEDIKFYLRKVQDFFGHEIGFHNDLVTLQLMYDIPPREYLKNELKYLRDNYLNIYGTTYHGSQYCYIYKYYNAYFWHEYPDNGWNYEYITKGYKTIRIEKDSLRNYDFQYEGGLLNEDYFFTDVNYINGARWHMGMVDFDTIRPGKKVIILLHPALWD